MNNTSPRVNRFHKKLQNYENKDHQLRKEDA